MNTWKTLFSKRARDVTNNRVVDYEVEVVAAERLFFVRNLLQAYEAEFSAVTNKAPGLDGVFPLVLIFRIA
jgi:hypothetical protein